MTTPELPPYQQRVITERDELKQKWEKLVTFFDTPNFEGLDPEDKSLLEKQANVMDDYLNILNRRIARF